MQTGRPESPRPPASQKKALQRVADTLKAPALKAHSARPIFQAQDQPSRIRLQHRAGPKVKARRSILSGLWIQAANPPALNVYRPEAALARAPGNTLAQLCSIVEDAAHPRHARAAKPGATQSASPKRPGKRLQPALGTAKDQKSCCCSISWRFRPLPWLSMNNWGTEGVPSLSSLQ